MSEQIHVLAQQLLGKNSIEECGLEEVRQLANDYPYFAPAQFLLLQKLRQDNATGYDQQLQKSVLYYHDPLAFEYFISPERFYTELPPENGDISDETTADEENILPTGSVETTTASTTGEEAYEDLAVAEEVSLASVEAGNEIEETALEVEVPAPQETFDETGSPDIVEEINPASSSDETTPDEAVESTEATPPLPKIDITIKEDTGTGLSFEPFHTVDYFASQGIKLSQEDATKDKFGKQLKSFTEWLKTMKRLSPAAASKEVDVSTEKKVQHLAEDSVHEADVVTEAMAEVWLKQGNKEKAIETYNKLGLLNPSKKTYFAALIENLKRS